MSTNIYIFCPFTLTSFCFDLKIIDILQIPDEDLEARRIGQRVDSLNNTIYSKEVWNPDKPEPSPKKNGGEDEEEEEEEEEEEAEEEINLDPDMVRKPCLHFSLPLSLLFSF